MRMSKETVQRVEGTRKRFQGYLLVVSVARVAARRPPRPWRGGEEWLWYLGRVGHLRATLIATGIEILGWLTQIHVS